MGRWFACRRPAASLAALARAVVLIGALDHSHVLSTAQAALGLSRSLLAQPPAGGDPLKLMRLFGITEKTAMHYVGTAHPERTAKLPRCGGPSAFRVIRMPGASARVGRATAVIRSAYTGASAEFTTGPK